ncbi:hypothetical protein [Actomonas aquatica]|uniref:Anti-sigma factor n=1 Tax=Actomonas aquatica TaxID=2866162 RepID=A0ABZ1C1Z8_9BACT|nr:hypothetical protein [Opitutus sp. WL0086]WRQ85664.1 hypothetical protein K1X11_012700 [Opitutus sp. WL0086]
MSAERDQFEQLVIACLEAPDDTTARAQLDALLTAHPEWIADRTEIETLWHAAHLTAPTLGETPVPNAPALPPEIEARLMEAHSNTAKVVRVSFRTSWWMAAAAAIAVLLTLFLWPRGGGGWTLDAQGQLTTRDAADALLAYADGQWTQVGAWDTTIDPAQRATLEYLTGQATNAKPSRPRSANAVEVWSPLRIHSGDTEFLLYSPIDRTVQLEVRAFESSAPLWSTSVTLTAGQPQSVPAPSLPPAVAYDLFLTPADSPLAQQHLRFGQTIATPSADTPVPLWAAQNLLQNNPPVGELIVRLLPAAKDSAGARQLLRAIAAGYDLPNLAAYVGKLHSE